MSPVLYRLSYRDMGLRKNSLQSVEKDVLDCKSEHSEKLKIHSADSRAFS